MRYKTVYQAGVIAFFAFNMFYICFSIYEQHLKNILKRTTNKAQRLIQNPPLRLP